ncbi:MAG: type VI secretion system-associated protein TagF, partial [Acetobacteraceae bacterium]
PDWLPAWLEAPVWRFSLAPAICGARSAIGLMLPSVDRAGRYFPLTLAAISDTGAPSPEADDWLDACEAAGRAALDRDLLPAQIAELVPPPPPFDSEAPTGTTWWTDGGPRVPASRLTFLALPDADAFVAMLDAGRQTAATGAP